ncbi:hypothetical protein ACS0TY_028413 [Phlomoides rotata]
MDEKAHSHCLEKNLHCYALTTDGVDFSGEAFFMSEDYLKMVWRKIDFQRSVLELGYDFVFTDGDVMWLRDPFPNFYPDIDFQVACDHYMFIYTDLNNSPNTGFIYAKSNNRTIQFYKYWYMITRQKGGKLEPLNLEIEATARRNRGRNRREQLRRREEMVEDNLVDPEVERALGGE